MKNGETNSSSLSSPSSSESLTKLNSSIETASPNANNNNSNKPFAAPKLSIHEENRDFLSTETSENNDDDEIFAPSEKRRDSRSKSLRFLNFNGHTNVEILILSSLALLTCLSLHFKIDYIYRVIFRRVFISIKTNRLFMSVFRMLSCRFSHSNWLIS